jgi:pilus assembly protein CpaB
MKNRTIIGIVFVAVAIIITFLVAPLTNKLTDNKTEVIRLKRDIKRGSQINENDIEKVTVGSYNLPSNVTKDKKLILGKYATCDLKTGDYIFPSKVTDIGDSADDVFRTLDGDKQAMSITISSFAGGLSGKLENGDIVSLVVYSSDSGTSFVPPELMYVRVITTTTANGNDKDNLVKNDDGTYELPSTVTLLVNLEQAILLQESEVKGKIHIVLVYRGKIETQQKFLTLQEEYFKENINNTEEKEETEEKMKEEWVNTNG